MHGFQTSASVLGCVLDGGSLAAAWRTPRQVQSQKTKAARTLARLSLAASWVLPDRFWEQNRAPAKSFRLGFQILPEPLLE